MDTRKTTRTDAKPAATKPEDVIKSGTGEGDDTDGALALTPSEQRMIERIHHRPQLVKRITASYLGDVETNMVAKMQKKKITVNVFLIKVA